MSNDYQAEATAADEREYLASAMAPAEVDLGPGPKSAIAIRLSGTDVERLKARADEEGVGFTQARPPVDPRTPGRTERAPGWGGGRLATLRSYISRGYVAEATEGRPGSRPPRRQERCRRPVRTASPSPRRQEQRARCAPAPARIRPDIDRPSPNPESGARKKWQALKYCELCCLPLTWPGDPLWAQSPGQAR